MTKKKEKSSGGKKAVRSQAFSSDREMFPPPGDQTSLGGLWEEREPFPLSFFYSVTLKKRSFKTGERSRLSENSRAETRGNDKRNQPILDFLRLLLWKRCNVFADGILWWWLYCLFSLWVFLSGWICTHTYTHALTWLKWAKRKDEWEEKWMIDEAQCGKMNRAPQVNCAPPHTHTPGEAKWHVHQSESVP